MTSIVALNVGNSTDEKRQIHQVNAQQFVLLRYFDRKKSHRPAEIVSSPAASSGTGGCCTSGVTTAGLATISTGLH